jgi:hypothetical protein
MTLKQKKASKNSKYWRTKADDELRRVVYERDGHKCIICGCTKNIQPHHLLRTSKNASLRHDVPNCVTLCAGHHTCGSESAHYNAVWFSEELKRLRPYQWRITLFRSDLTCKNPKHNYKAEYERLKNE